MNQRPDRPNFHLLAELVKIHAIILFCLVGVIWLLEIIDILFFGQALNQFGVRPRDPAGLWGILLMPFLHGGLGHVAANTVPFVVLGWLVMVRRLEDFLTVTAITMLGTGLGLWIFGQGNGVYIGASGLVFGYFGYLLLRGYFERSCQSLSIALFVALAYGGLIWGVFPQHPGISWEAHLLGFLSGALAARILANNHRARHELEIGD